MAIYTPEELDLEIAQAKLDLAAARKILSYNLSTGGNQSQVQRQKITEIQEHLVWLQSQQDTAAGSVVGRTYAKNGGRG